MGSVVVIKDDKNEEHVTIYQLERIKKDLEEDLSNIDDKLDRVDKFHERNFESLKDIFKMFQDTIESLNDNMKDMVHEQRKINDNITEITLSDKEQEIRITRTEEKLKNFEPSKKSEGLNVEKLKIVAYVIFLLITMILGILGIEALPSFPFSK